MIERREHRRPVAGPVADGGAEYLGQIGPCMLLGAVTEAFPEAVEHLEDLAGAFVVQIVGGEALEREPLGKAADQGRSLGIQHVGMARVGSLRRSLQRDVGGCLR